jgi:hypothetical protein
VYTPPNVAAAMVQALGAGASDLWLEPCVGKGALLQALRNAGVKSRQITGIDLSREPEPSDKFARVSRGTEFLHWSMSTPNRYNKIIANPPYVAIDRLQARLRKTACNVRALGEIRVTAAGNTWYAFLCAAINLLRPGGSLCFLLPAAWEFANYAEPLRREIAKSFKSVRVYRSDTPLFQFAKVQEGAVMLLAREFSPSVVDSNASGAISSLRVKSAEDLVAQMTGRLPARGNQTEEASGWKLNSPNLQGPFNGVPIGDLFSINIGAVTGDANYFLMNEERRRALDLPMNSLRPVLSRAKHLACSRITESVWRSLKENGERVWLFDPSPSALDHAAVKRYIRWGRNGGCNLEGYKVLIRSPWYRVRTPARLDGFLSGMSKIGPWISFRYMDRLTATNTLYGITFEKTTSQNARAAFALGLLTSRAQDQFMRRRRTYADGLIKFELGDLREVRIPICSSSRGAIQSYSMAVSALLKGQPFAAAAIADHWFAQS